jgi:hypothetical protein
MVGLWQWIKDQIVQDAPEEIALCEFDCHKQQCTEREWQTCPRRIAWAAGELMPAPETSAVALEGRFGSTLRPQSQSMISPH